MKLTPPANVNYSATVVQIVSLIELPGLDNLIGVSVLGHQALTQKGKGAGEIVVAFTAETQLSEDFCAINSLYRDATLNKNPGETGYLEKNRRIRALRLRGHVSNALLMPLSSLEFTGFPLSTLNVGDTFDSLNGHDICCKYEVPVKQGSMGQPKTVRADPRVDEKLFPQHLSTDQYHRNKHLLKPDRDTIVTQKLHGTSLRVGRVPVRRTKSWWERTVSKVTRIKTPDREFEVVFGSRKVIKDANNPRQQHFYKEDIWTRYGQSIAEHIPENYIAYGELIGWTLDGGAIQRGYTYNVPEGTAEFYVYRVSFINGQGIIADLPWDGVKEFCIARGLKTVPELFRLRHWEVEGGVAILADKRFADDLFETNDPVLPLSDKKTVDEGLCIRQDGFLPTILKAKSTKFLEHETKLNDQDVVDIESAA